MEYYVNVEPRDASNEDDSQENNINGCDFSSEASLNAIKTEYEYCLQRSQKLDTKLQIVVTICAIYFGGVLSFINTLPKPALPSTHERLYVLALFYVLVVLQLFLKIYIFYAVINLIKGVGVGRIKQENIITNKVFEKDRNEAYKYLCKKYDECVRHNTRVQETRYKKFNSILTILFYDIILITVCVVMKVIILPS